LVVVGEFVSPSSKLLLVKEKGRRKYQLPTNRQQGNKVVKHEATKQQIGGRCQEVP
jgi:hypothetical protein